MDEINELKIEQNSNNELDEHKEIILQSPAEKFDELKERMLTDLLQSPIKVWDEENHKTNSVLVGDVIDRNDVWYSKDKPKPIIKASGIKKIVKATNAIFEDVIIIEKQSNFGDVRKGQVWMEARVIFPNGETHKEKGIANALNCKDEISMANMPIMAEKRAKDRALLHSDFVNLDVFGEVEVSDELNKMFLDLENKNEKLLKNNQSLVEKYNDNVRKSIDFYKSVEELAVYIDKKGNKLTASQAKNPVKLENFIQSIKNEKDPQFQFTPLQEFIFMARLELLNKGKGKANEEQIKAKTEEIIKAKRESKNELDNAGNNSNENRN